MNQNENDTKALTVVENSVATVEPDRGGRPSKYEPRFAEMLIDYFSVKPYEEIKRKSYHNGEEVISTEKETSDFPSLAGFAISIGVHRDTLHQWAASEKYPEFSDAYKRAKEYQENWLVVNGLRGLVPPAFGIFTAKNVIGWRDKQPGEADVIINNVGKYSDEELDRQIDEKMKRLSGSKDGNESSGE